MKYTVEVDEKFLNIIINYLAEGPYKITAPVIGEIQTQILEQNKKLAEINSKKEG